MVKNLITHRLASRCSDRTNIARSLRIACAIIVGGVTAAAVPLGGAMAQVANLNGQWTSQYTCPSGETLPLVLQITQQGQNISAVTAAADACLHAGTLAFSGTVYGNGGQLQCGEIYDRNPSTLNPNDNSQSFGDFFAQALGESLANSVAGPDRYAVRYGPGAIQIISPASIVACTLVFSRVGSAPFAAVAPQPAQNAYPANAGATIFYCSRDGSAYARGKGGILCPGPRGTAPICPHGYACTCIDVDGSCTDGDDDWGYVAAAPVAPVAPVAVPPYPTAAPPVAAYPPRAGTPAQAPQERLSRTGREQWLQYLDAPDIKAFAMSKSSGSFGWRRGRATIKDATDGAIAACKEADCEVISINGKSKWGN